MKIGFIGLGKMGQNIVLHLLEQGVDVVAFNRTSEITKQFDKLTKQQIDNAPSMGSLMAVFDVKELVKKLPTPRVIWLMVPNGDPVDAVIKQLLDAGLERGDIVIDGGNCWYKDSVRREKEMSWRGIHFIDCGTSGGLEGARNGACLMIGGDKKIVESLADLWNAIAVSDGWGYFGPTGAGHFVKMVHNGVEYGMNQALGEGFHILAEGPYQLDLANVGKVWAHGSVVRGWLVELLARALAKDGRLEEFTGRIGGGETGKWTVEVAKDLGIPVNVLMDALVARQKSQTSPSFASKVVSALRKEYGGHGESGEHSKPQ